MPVFNDINHRPPKCAGSFYPSDKNELNTFIDSLLEKSPKILNEKPVSVIVPHAGYVFSGTVAAKVYNELQGLSYSTVIIIAPSHTKHFSGASVFSGETYITPLGNAFIDKELAKSISDHSEQINLSLDGHEWNNGRSEHAIEVQIPFIQKVLPDTKIVPIVIGDQEFITQTKLSDAIYQAIENSGKDVLIIASSDLSHFHSLSEANQMDNEFINAVENYDYFRLSLECRSRNWEACGYAPISVAMQVAERMNANKCEIMDYATSADSEYIDVKDSSRVVGYMSAIFYSSDQGELNILPEIHDDEKELLKEYARQALYYIVRGDSITINLPEKFTQKYAAFVTLKKNSELRGCMGHTVAKQSLDREIVECTQMAALRDPRFMPVKENELADIKVDITILSRFVRLYSIEDIKIGEDGVYLRNGFDSGLFLPQVASEQGWSKLEFLKHLGKKAKLGINAYKDSKTELYKFKALVIH